MSDNAAVPTGAAETFVSPAAAVTRRPSDMAAQAGRALRAGRREAILSGPVLPTLLRLGLPTIGVLLAQTVVAIAETYWTSFLGIDAIAGVALVFPLTALMTAVSNGGIGGGVSAAVARAVGAGRGDEADALVAHALVLAIAFGVLFTTGAFAAGPALYRAMGGSGDALAAALRFSGWFFAGAVPIWAVNLIAAALRGAGEVRLPASVTLTGALVTILLSPALIFGVGPLPRMGVGGAGPLHVNAGARLMGSWPAVSPVSPGVLCALGDATTRMRTELARALSKRTGQTSDAEVAALLAQMGEEVRAGLAAEGAAPDQISVEYEVDVRYHGQAFEVSMPVQAQRFEAGGLARLAAAFDAEHRRLFTFNMDAEHEFVNLRAVALGRVLDIPALEIEAGDGDPSSARLRDHEVWVDGGFQPAVIYARPSCGPGTASWAPPSWWRWTPPPWCCPAARRWSTASA